MPLDNVEMRQEQGAAPTRQDDERDLCILYDWENNGWTARKLAKTYGVSVEYVKTLVREALS